MSNLTQKSDWTELSINKNETIALFEQAQPLTSAQLLDLQPRLKSNLRSFCEIPFSVSNLMVLNIEEGSANFSVLQQITEYFLPSNENSTVLGASYKVGPRTTVSNAKSYYDNFAATERCIAVDWIESEQLFGCLRSYNDELQLDPGVVHKVNGGMLIINVHTLLMQPLLWLRLKNILLTQTYHWLASEDGRTLPIAIPPMELNLKLIIVGDIVGLDEFQQIEPSLYNRARYGEFEHHYLSQTNQNRVQWFAYIKGISQLLHLPALTPECAPLLLTAGYRTLENRQLLPLAPSWLQKTINYARVDERTTPITAEQLQQALQQQLWHESYLQERLFRDFDTELLYIATEGQVIGQINALSVIEYPGHPRPFGEPSRLSCVLFFGEGELIDIERKVELAGNIHSKGMLIMQAYLASQLNINHQLPFNASLVFEQSYSGIDGDSASLAGLCTLISALSQQPIDQQLAVTGSVDQFGRVQGIGGINEKIESFFALCQKRGLTGKQGIIFPASNRVNLVLNQSVIDAIQANQFHLYPVTQVEEAIQHLIGLPFSGDQHLITLKMLIKKRINRFLDQNEKQHLPWFLRWLVK